jgi:hypothetical protein
LQQVDWARAKLEKPERSGFTIDTKEQILKQSKPLLNGNHRKARLKKYKKLIL